MGDMADYYLEQIWDCWQDFGDEDMPHIPHFDRDNWKTRDGKIIRICEMTDEHLTNALNLCRKRGKYKAEQRLSEELVRRIHVRFLSKIEKCPWCKATMKRVKYESDPEDGPGPGWTKYAFTCEKCGARGPLHQKDLDFQNSSSKTSPT